VAGEKAAPINQLETRLLDFGAAALDENHQHDYEQDAADNANNCGTVHFPFLSLQSEKNSQVLAPGESPASIEGLHLAGL
jgi:hypothetical protein